MLVSKVFHNRRKVEVKKRKRKRKIAEQAREPIVKKIRKVVEKVSSKEDWVKKSKGREKEKTEEHGNVHAYIYLFKIEESCPYE